MPSRITSQQYGQAVLDHIEKGAYPESEEVISEELPPSALPDIAKLVDQAREDVKANIKYISKESAPDIDGWISQAKQLRFDIQRSQEIATDIVQRGRHGEILEEQVKDASSKIELLNGELAFNKSLTATLERLQALWQTLELVQRAILDDRLLNAVDLLGEADKGIAHVSTSRSTKAAGILASRSADLQSEVVEKLTDSWNDHIRVNLASSTIEIESQAKGSSTASLESVVSGFSKLRCLDKVLLPFCHNLERLVVLPRLRVQADNTVVAVKIEGQKILVSEQSSDLSARTLFSNLKSIIDFLRSRLPNSIVEPLASQIMPQLITRLISTWLASAVPEDLQGMEDFEDTLNLTRHFADTLGFHQWPGRSELLEWTNSIPNIWLRKRQETSLNQVRRQLSLGFGAIETVERIETQTLTQDDGMFAANGGGDDWNANWSDEEEEKSPIKTMPPSEPREGAVGEGGEEEDVSAWGLDEDGDGENANDPRKSVESVAPDDDADAWGWGEENEGNEASERKEPSHSQTISAKKPASNGHSKQHQQAEREITLKEIYNITSLPKEILEIISQIISDAKLLETPDHANSPVASAAPTLFSLPGLILAMYRASASSTYAHHASGNMFLYNDNLWLAERLHHLSSHQTALPGQRIQSRTVRNLNLKAHVSALESHGKRAYAKEMESQRTIITDLLDGAQGFMQCTEHPFNQECDIAIASAVDRLRQLHKEWKAILSFSALLQSLGSLLSTVIKKLIVDIEDMSDISEPESQQLATYCTRIATLEDLFAPQPQSSAVTLQQETVPLTAIYTPGWLKFQYLANILESSLVDIRFLWTEGELSLEFGTEELVELIAALFADSPHRRAAVAEIRRSRR